MYRVGIKRTKNGYKTVATRWDDDGFYVPGAEKETHFENLHQLYDALEKAERDIRRIEINYTIT